MRAREPAPTLIGDIGGTSARFALVEGTGEPDRVRVLSCAAFPGPEAAVAAYLERIAPPVVPKAAVIAVAAPVDGDRVRMTNHPWAFSVAETRAGLGLESLEVVNDFTAMALSVPRLEAGDRRAIGGGAPRPRAPVAVLGPGTGLGVSGLVPAGDGGWIPLVTEGGHATLAAADARERAVVAALARRYGHVSIERAVSGGGIVNLARAIAEIDGGPAPPDDPALIAAAARTDPLAGQALDMFASMLGTAASNLALGLGARGGVYIGGGIVPRLGPAFPDGRFRARFEDKGRYRGYLSAIPTYVITRPEPALLGLAALAASPGK